MCESCVGCLAYSMCGRDRKRLFCVVGVCDEDFVLLANGDLRKLDRPKRKRLKHLQFTGFEGKYVPLKETIRGFREIVEGKHDDIPESAFLFAGSIDDVVAKAKGEKV